jgi:hypothetical protein
MTHKKVDWHAIHVFLIVSAVSACGGGSGGSDAGTGTNVSQPTTGGATPPPGTNDPTLEPDGGPPGTIVAAGTPEVTLFSATVSWIATGDHGDQGTAMGYEVFISSDTPPCDASPCSVAVAPGARPAGELERLTIRPLEPDRAYTITVQAFDDANNYSNRLTFSATTLNNVGGWQLETISGGIGNPGQGGDLAFSASGSAAIGFGVLGEPDPDGLGVTGFFDYAEQMGSSWIVQRDVSASASLDYPRGVDLERTAGGEMALVWSGGDEIFEPTASSRHVYMERSGGVWGTPEEITGGLAETNDLADTWPSLTFVDGVAHVVYAGRGFINGTPYHSLVLRRRIAPGVWTAKQELMSCPSRPDYVQALTLPADPSLGTAERLLIAANYEGSVVLVRQDSSGGWLYSHTGPLGPSTTHWHAAMRRATVAPDGTVGLLIGGDGNGDPETEEIGIVELDWTQLLDQADACSVPSTLNQQIDWIPESGDALIGDQQSFSIRSGEVHVMHSDIVEGTNDLTLRLHSRCNGSWIHETIDRIPNPSIAGPALDPSGNVVISYVDGKLGELYYAHRVGNPCSSGP